MLAAQIASIPAKRLTLANVPMPTAPPGKVVIKVNACGICGTDLHLMDGSSFHPQLPFTLGHQPVGIVAAVGSSADERWLGAKVTATIFERLRIM